MRLGWKPKKPVDLDGIQGSLDNQASLEKDEMYTKRAKLLDHDLKPALQRAMEHLFRHDEKERKNPVWPLNQADSFILVDGKPVRSWWVGASPRHNVSFRVTTAGDLVTTPMRGVRDVGVRRPEADHLRMDDPKFEDIQFGEDLLRGLRDLATAKLTLLERAKQSDRHRE